MIGSVFEFGAIMMPFFFRCSYNGLAGGERCDFAPHDDIGASSSVRSVSPLEVAAEPAAALGGICPTFKVLPADSGNNIFIDFDGIYMSSEVSADQRPLSGETSNGAVYRVSLRLNALSSF